jgi:peptide deformylase
MLKIVTIPHPSLNQVAKPVPRVDKKMQQFVSQLHQTLDAQKNPEGVGLSAPQVAVGKRVFVVKHPDTRERFTFINPEYLTQQEMMDEDDDENLEGCLSIPEIWAPVYRYKQVEIQYLDETGTQQTALFDGFLSVVIQHEMDHLDGILFTARAVEQQNPIYREVNGKLREISTI